jgi:hypothetical protein
MHYREEDGIGDDGLKMHDATMDRSSFFFSSSLLLTAGPAADPVAHSARLASSG